MIGLGITTTSKRKEVFETCLAEWDKFGDDIDFLFINYDDTYKGVAVSKNKCLKALYEAGCTEFFLADDDVMPLRWDWWKPYVESKEPHLMYQFKLPNKPSTDMQEVYRDEEIVAYTHTRGAFIYLNKIILDTVGGFDTDYKGAYFEHPDLTNRIHNAGLTTYRAMDVPNSSKLLYCFDQDGKTETSIPDKRNYTANWKLYNKNRYSKEYKEFR